MTDLFAAKSAEPWRWPFTKAHVRGAIWVMALALFVLLPKPFTEVDGERAAAQVVAER